jgi:hypothetical protein
MMVFQCTEARPRMVKRATVRTRDQAEDFLFIEDRFPKETRNNFRMDGAMIGTEKKAMYGHKYSICGV